MGRIGDDLLLARGIALESHLLGHVVKGGVGFVAGAVESGAG
jgi:hypothetical protein